MAETDTTEAAAPAEDTDERLDRVEAAVDRIEAAITRLVPGSHAEAEQRTEEHLDRGSTVEDQVRAELAKAKREEQAAADEQAKQAEHETVQQRLARLEEKPPAPPRLRRTRLLGWGDGR